MSDAGSRSLPRRARVATKKRRPARPTFLGVIGELLITAGLFVLLFVVWELYWTNLGANREAQAHRDIMSDAFGQNYDAGFDGSGPDPSVPAEVTTGNPWGMLYIPRFGPDYAVPVLDGTGEEINSAVLGRYDNAPRPGEDGNLALAGHRQTYGAVLWDMDQLQEGDRMYLQTANGWWVYETRMVHIVEPSDLEVLAPDPMDPASGEPDGQWLTLTTCHPPYTVLERMITHAELVEFVPLADGAPAEIADAATELQAGPVPAIHSPDEASAMLHRDFKEA